MGTRVGDDELLDVVVLDDDVEVDFVVVVLEEEVDEEDPGRH